jgi:hypothetical protein
LIIQTKNTYFKYNKALNFIAFSALLVLLTSTSLLAQDSTRVDTSAKARSPFVQAFQSRWNMKPHSPLKASLYSAALPGAGQWYNAKAYSRKYWKVPFVYIGLGTATGFIISNTKNYRYYKSQYIAQVDNDPNTIVTANPLIDLKTTQEQYHKWLDLSYMSLVVIYFLQIIDANVDAHLFYFDVGKDLSLSFHPSIVNTGCITTGLSISLRL